MCMCIYPTPAFYKAPFSFNEGFELRIIGPKQLLVGLNGLSGRIKFWALGRDDGVEGYRTRD